MANSLYDEAFFENMAAVASQSAKVLVPMALEYVQPASVVDVGCGTGAWLAEFHKQGVADIRGLDGPWVDQRVLQIPADSFRVTDLTKPIPVDRRFDLVVSLEVAEHLPPEAASGFVQGLTALGPVVLFSASVPYQGGTGHVNERWQSYWVELFAARGYVAIDCLRSRLWDDLRVELCYAQNIFFAVDRSTLDRWPALAEAAARTDGRVIDLVHPRLFIVTAAGRKEPVELLHGFLGAVRDKWLVQSRRREAKRRIRTSRWPNRQEPV